MTWASLVTAESTPLSHPSNLDRLFCLLPSVPSRQSSSPISILVFRIPRFPTRLFQDSLCRILGDLAFLLIILGLKSPTRYEVQPSSASPPIADLPDSVEPVSLHDANFANLHVN